MQLLTELPFTRGMSLARAHEAKHTAGQTAECDEAPVRRGGKAVLRDVRTHAPRALLPGGNSALEPPDSIPNSAVKRCSADGSAGVPV